MIAALRQLAADLWAEPSYPLLRLRFCTALNSRCGGRYDDLLTRIFSKPKLDLPRPEIAVSPIVESLRSHGWAMLPFQLPKSTLAELQALAVNTPMNYRWDSFELTKLPSIQKLLLVPTFHSIAQEYFGSQPFLTNVAVYQEVAGSNTNSQLYHYDNDGPKFLKFFFYLTDILTPNDGAHTFIQDSHNHAKPPQFKGLKSYTRASLVAHYGQENEISITGPAGTGFVEDSACFHHGTKPKNRRLLLQIQYAVMDTPCMGDPSRPLHIPNLDPTIGKVVGKFYC
jgi:hypothetical protein